MVSHIGPASSSWPRPCRRSALLSLGVCGKSSEEAGTVSSQCHLSSPAQRLGRVCCAGLRAEIVAAGGYQTLCYETLRLSNCPTESRVASSEINGQLLKLLRQAVEAP